MGSGVRHITWLVAFACAASPWFSEARGELPRDVVRSIRETLGAQNLEILIAQAPDPLAARSLLSDLEQELVTDRYVVPTRLRVLSERFRETGSSWLPIAQATERLANAWEDPNRENFSARCLEYAARATELTRPVGQIDQESLAQSLSHFDRFLAQLGERQPHWQEYLLWEATKQLPHATDLAPSELDRLQTRWANAALVWNHGTLQLTGYQVRRSIEFARRRQNPQVAADTERFLKQLASATANPETRATEQGRLDITQAVAGLERLGVAPELTTALRRDVSQPGCAIHVSGDLLRRHLVIPIAEQFPVNGVFEGTSTSGQGQVNGTLSWVPVPSGSLARWRWTYASTIQSTTTGFNSGVRVDSRSTAYVNGQKQFRLDASGLSTVPSTADAVATVMFDNILSGGRAIRRQRATNEVMGRRDRIQGLTAQSARSESATRLDREGDRFVDSFNASYEQNFRRPLGRSLNYVTTVQTSSSDAGLTWNAWIEPLFGLSWHARPPATPESDVATLIHGEFVERLAEVQLAGRQVTSDEISKQFAAWQSPPAEANSGRVENPAAANARPAGGQSANSDDDWRLHFASERPLVCTAVDGVVKMELRLTEFSSSDAVFPSVAIQIAYRPEWQDGEWHWRRVGDIGVHPLDHQPGRRMSGRQLTLRRAVQRRLNKSLPEQWVLHPVVQEFGGRTLRLQARHLGVEAGWLVIGWNHTDSENQVGD